MKRIALIFITAILFIGCAVNKDSLVIGEYSGRTYWMGSEMSISLNHDKTFTLNWLNIDYAGEWEISGKNSVLLRFNEITDVLVILSSGVILDKERIIKFKNKNKLRLLPNKDVLKRTK